MEGEWVVKVDLLVNPFQLDRKEGGVSMDINNAINQLQQSSADFMENYCAINGNIWRIDQIEKMDLKEFADRSVYSLPTKFYKYFPDKTEKEKDDLGNVKIKNYSEIALETNEVFLNSPDKFDDVFDSEISISFDEFEIHRLKKLVQWSKCGGTTGSSAQDLGNAIVQCAYSMIQERGNIEGIFAMDGYGELERLQAESFRLSWTIEMGKKEISIALRTAIENEYNDFKSKLQNTFHVCCFTTSPMSQLMWGGSYANEHKGFCLEYTVQPDEEYVEVLSNIRPVIYSKRRRPITKAIMDAYDKNWNDQAIRDLYINGVLRKSIDWAYQNEWRLMLPPQDKNQKGFTKRFFPITKVYLGNRMPADRRKTIIEICKKKNIPYVGVVRSPDYFEMKECEQLCENCARMMN